MSIASVLLVTALLGEPRCPDPEGMVRVGVGEFVMGSDAADGRRVLKGCAWDDEPGLCRPAFRHGRPPASRHILIGFRCAGPAR